MTVGRWANFQGPSSLARQAPLSPRGEDSFEHSEHIEQRERADRDGHVHIGKEENYSGDRLSVSVQNVQNVQNGEPGSGSEDRAGVPGAAHIEPTLIAPTDWFERGAPSRENEPKYKEAFAPRRGRQEY